MKKRELSCRERAMIEDAITRVCHAANAPLQNPELRQAAWAAILSVYRDDPEGFAVSSGRGWRRAYRLAWDAVMRERQALWRVLYKDLSIDQPVSADNPVTLAEILLPPHGGFENSVCLHEYLAQQELDVRRMAGAFLEGETLEQLRNVYHWSPDHAYHVFNRLRNAMLEYERI